MKKLLVTLLFAATLFGIGVGASSAYYANMTSIGHRTYLLSDMRVEGQDNYQLTTTAITFQKLDDEVGMFIQCVTECFQETIKLVSNDTMSVTPELIVTINGVRVDSSRFGLVIKRNNMIVHEIHLMKDIEQEYTFTVYLRDDLTWEEMDKTLTLEIQFKGN
jgi:hypothetical protein